MSKAAKKRECPAVGHEISSAECGAKRESEYACPADCPFSPFAPANYDSLLELEKKVDRQCMQWAIDSAADPFQFRRKMESALRAPSPHILHAFFEWHLFFKRDAAGQTAAERWEQAGFPGLKNDERVLVRAKMKSRVALMEVHRVLDHRRVEMVDLLDPDSERFLILDYSLAANAVRFVSGLCWLYPLRHFRRVAGTTHILPDIASLEPLAVVREVVAHLGGPPAESEMQPWLAEHFVAVADAIGAVGVARHNKMLDNSNTQFGKAVYALRAPAAECVRRLDELEQVAVDDLGPAEAREGFQDARAWFTDEALQITDPDLPLPVLGRVLLGPTHWRVEAIGTERMAELRRRLEAHMLHRLAFQGERMDDLDPSRNQDQERFDASLVPPRLLDNVERIDFQSSRAPRMPKDVSQEECERRWRAANDRAFLDRSIPGLDHLSPREAARRPDLRPKLVRLIKHRVRKQDEDNLENGGTEDINWLVRELGLTEILFDPPPPRPRPKAPDARGVR